MTVISTVVVPVPPLFVALIVYVAVEETTVGVPLITPVVALKVRPFGKVRMGKLTK